MLHPPGHAAPRPVDVPIIVGALGPKGAGVARELGDGLYITLALPEFAKEFSWVSYLFWGTILGDGEDPGSDRVREAGGPGWALAYHGAYEFGTPLEDLPGGREWRAVVERTPPQERHLAVHDQHCVGLNEADRAAWEAGGGSMLGEVTMSGTPERVRERLAALGDQGVTEIVFQPCGTDIRRELEVFMDTAKTAVPA
jgi:5,10-methylenetetrahydromethanopterin reductase